jgi:hypothetical protein
LIKREIRRMTTGGGERKWASCDERTYYMIYRHKE